MNQQYFKHLSLMAALVCLFSFGCSTSYPKQTKKLKTDIATTELFRDIKLLQDIDAGNVNSACLELNNDAMTQIFTLIEGVGFTTNKIILLEQPGLRAAARYWRKKTLPNDIQIFNSSDVSNLVQQTITTIGPEFNSK